MIMEEPGDDPPPPASYRYLVEESRADGRLLDRRTSVAGPPADRKR